MGNNRRNAIYYHKSCAAIHTILNKVPKTMHQATHGSEPQGFVFSASGRGRQHVTILGTWQLISALRLLPASNTGEARLLSEFPRKTSPEHVRASQNVILSFLFYPSWREPSPGRKRSCCSHLRGSTFTCGLFSTPPNMHSQ